MLSQGRYQYAILFTLIPFPDPYTHKTIPTLFLILQPIPSNRQLRQSGEVAPGLAWQPTGIYPYQSLDGLPYMTTNGLQQLAHQPDWQLKQ